MLSGPTNFEAVPYSIVVRASDVARARGLNAQVYAGKRLVFAA
jgi:hypothetical protein